jgi:hypothetical protein
MEALRRDTTVCARALQSGYRRRFLVLQCETHDDEAVTGLNARHRDKRQ